MHWFRPLVSAVLIFTVLASGLSVPVYYHGHAEPEAEIHVHRVVHSHGGRVHVHVHHHHAHESDCHKHGSTNLCGDEFGNERHDPCHALDIWLNSAKCDTWKQVLSHLRLADDVHDAAVLIVSESCEKRYVSMRPPPERASPRDHLLIVRSVVLRL